MVCLQQERQTIEDCTATWKVTRRNFITLLFSASNFTGNCLLILATTREHNAMCFKLSVLISSLGCQFETKLQIGVCALFWITSTAQTHWDAMQLITSAVRYRFTIVYASYLIELHDGYDALNFLNRLGLWSLRGFYSKYKPSKKFGCLCYYFHRLDDRASAPQKRLHVCQLRYYVDPFQRFLRSQDSWMSHWQVKYGNSKANLECKSSADRCRSVKYAPHNGVMNACLSPNDPNQNS